MKEETKALINEKLNLYDSDKTGLPDFALENLGNLVILWKNMANVMNFFVLQHLL